MDIKNLKLDLETLFILDKFFKNQFRGSYRYGTIGFFYWKLVKNSSFPGTINGIFIDSALTSTASITPKTLLIKNKEFITAEIGDTYVAKRFSGRGFFFKLVNFSKAYCVENNLNFIYGTPNSQSFPGYIKYCGFEKSEIIKPYSFSYLLEIKSHLKLKVGCFFANIFNLPYRLFLKIHHITLFLLSNFNSGYNLEEVSFFSIDFDKFFNKVSSEWDFIFSRTSKHLNWRFCDNPENYTIFLVKKNEEIVGYFVYKIILSQPTSKLVVADFLVSKNHTLAFNIVFHRLRKVAFANNLSIINTWCDINSLFVPNLLKNGLIFKKEISFINFKNFFIDSMNSIKNIHFTISDTDNI